MSVSPLSIDPSLFDPAAVDGETRQANELLERLLASTPSVLEVPAREVRAARAEGRSFAGPVIHSDRAVDQIIDGPAGPLPLRVFSTPGARGVLLHIHGGGWALGAHDLQDPMLETVAATARVSVVSVGYRLAPEHPYPAANDDCETAALWLARHAQVEFGTGRLFIGGESAGAHLSVTTLLRLRDRHGLRPFAAACLTYGAFDLGLTPSARRWGARNLVLSTPIMERFIEWYAPPDVGDPDASPLYGDLRGLPPALFSVGTIDPLLDDTLFMASRWIAAGNAAELAVYPGGVHGFNALPTALSRRANTRLMEFIGRHSGA
ncbi:MAG: alpha/beta hydrolase [Steroidobacteraceae bacterium]